MRLSPIIWIKHRARSATYGTIVTLLLAFVGLVGSIYTTEIKQAFPFTWPWWRMTWKPFALAFNFGGWSWEAFWFWVSLAVSGVVFGVRQAATDSEQRERISELERVIRTIPTADFLGRFSQVYELADRAAQAVLARTEDEPTPAKAEAAIRSVLRAILVLAATYDGGAKSRYGANIMLFRPSNTIPEEEWPQIRDRMKFDPIVDRGQLAGILDLELDLSVADDDESQDRDSQLRPLAMAIPTRTEFQVPGIPIPRSRVLPGAPLAFIHWSADHYLDTAQLASWCEENGDFSLEVKAALTNYFAPRPELRVRSLLAVAIQPDSKSPPIAVLNIHRDSPGLLKETDSALQQFVPLLGPLALLLARLLICRQGSLAQVPSPAMVAQ